MGEEGGSSLFAACKGRGSPRFLTGMGGCLTGMGGCLTGMGGCLTGIGGCLTGIVTEKKKLFKSMNKITNNGESLIFWKKYLDYELLVQ